MNALAEDRDKHGSLSCASSQLKNGELLNDLRELSGLRRIINSLDVVCARVSGADREVKFPLPSTNRSAGSQEKVPSVHMQDNESLPPIKRK